MVVSAVLRLYNAGELTRDEAEGALRIITTLDQVKDLVGGL